MKALFFFIVGFEAIAIIVSIILLAFQIKERIKEKPKDDNELSKFDKY